MVVAVADRLHGDASRAAAAGRPGRVAVPCSLNHNGGIRGQVRYYMCRRGDVVSLQAEGIGESGRCSWRRGQIRGWTDPSRVRLLRACHEIERRFEFARHICLTYRGEGPRDGRDADRDLRLFLDRLRYRIPKLLYLAKKEFQARGVVHWHVWVFSDALDVLDIVHLSEDAVREAWSEVVGLECVCSSDLWKSSGVVGYCKAYAGKHGRKEYQHHVPDDWSNVGRWWRMSRGLRARPVRVEVRRAEFYKLRRRLRHLMTARRRESAKRWHRSYRPVRTRSFGGVWCVVAAELQRYYCGFG